jgi:hypothetical protein
MYMYFVNVWIFIALNQMELVSFDFETFGHGQTYTVRLTPPPKKK